jgi:hypothetical protein
LALWRCFKFYHKPVYLMMTISSHTFETQKIVINICKFLKLWSVTLDYQHMYPNIITDWSEHEITFILFNYLCVVGFFEKRTRKCTSRSYWANKKKCELASIALERGKQLFQWWVALWNFLQPMLNRQNCFKAESSLTYSCCEKNWKYK